MYSTLWSVGILHTVTVCVQEGNKNTYDSVVRKEASEQQIVVRSEKRTHTTLWSVRKQVDKKLWSGGNKNTYNAVVRKEATGQQIVVRRETRTHTTLWSGRNKWTANCGEE